MTAVSGRRRRSVRGHVHGQVPREVREDQLLEVAERLFLADGYVGTAIGDVARAAGVSRPIVYQHFGSKEQLYLAVVRRIRGGFEGTLRAAAAQAPTVEALLRAGSTAFFGLLEADAPRWWLVYGGTGVGVGDLATALVAEREKTVEEIAEVFGGLLPGADPLALTLAAHAVSGAGEQLGRYWLAHPDVPIEEVVAAHVRYSLPAFRQPAPG